MKQCGAPAPDATRSEPAPSGRPTTELPLHGVMRVGWTLGEQSTRRVLACVARSPPCRRLACSAPAGSIRARARPAEQSDMKINAALAADLGILTAPWMSPAPMCCAACTNWASMPWRLFPAYLGLSVTVDGCDPPFTFSTFADGAVDNVRTSLRLTPPADVDDGRAAPSVALILYAATPGSFVDLTADLVWLTGRPPSDFALDQHLSVPAGSDAATYSAHDVGHQSSHRGAHRPRLRSAASTFEIGQRSLWHPHRWKRRRADHSRLAHCRGPDPRRAHRPGATTWADRSQHVQPRHAVVPMHAPPAVVRIMFYRQCISFDGHGMPHANRVPPP